MFLLKKFFSNSSNSPSVQQEYQQIKKEQSKCFFKVPLLFPPLSQSPSFPLALQLRSVFIPESSALSIRAIISSPYTLPLLAFALLFGFLPASSRNIWTSSSFSPAQPSSSSLMSPSQQKPHFLRSQLLFLS